MFNTYVLLGVCLLFLDTQSNPSITSYSQRSSDLGQYSDIPRRLQSPYLACCLLDVGLEVYLPIRPGEPLASGFLITRWSCTAGIEL